MEYKKIIENGHLVEVKILNEDEVIKNSLPDLFKEQEKLGYLFLKAFKEGGKKQVVFIKKEDYERILIS